MCLFGYLEHREGSINRRNDPMSFNFVNCRIFVYLSNKTNFTKDRFIKSEL